MATPIGVEVTPPVRASETVGVRCEIVMVKALVVAVAPLLSLT